MKQEAAMFVNGDMSKQVPISFLSVVLSISLGYIDLPQVFAMALRVASLVVTAGAPWFQPWRKEGVFGRVLKTRS
jgi:hypothetical protein